MTLEQLRALLWVARLNGFAAAARRLNATQPGISTRIRNLEDELGVALFERTTRSVEPTLEGRRCLALAESILGQVDRIVAEVGTAENLAGSFRIGVGDCVASTWLSGLIDRLGDLHPRLRIDVEVGAFFPLLDRLRGYDCDLLLIGGSADSAEARRIAVEYLGSLDYAWMMAGHRPEPKDGPMTPADLLQALRVLAYTENTLISNMVEDWFASDGSLPVRWYACDNTATVASLTSAGLGVGLLPATIYADEIAQRKLRVIETIPAFPPLHYYAMYARTAAGPVHAAIVALAKEICDFPKLLTVA